MGIPLAPLVVPSSCQSKAPLSTLLHPGPPAQHWAPRWVERLVLGFAQKHSLDRSDDKPVEVATRFLESAVDCPPVARGGNLYIGIEHHRSTKEPYNMIHCAATCCIRMYTNVGLNLEHALRPKHIRPIPWFKTPSSTFNISQHTTSKIWLETSPPTASCFYPDLTASLEHLVPLQAAKVHAEQGPVLSQHDVIIVAVLGRFSGERPGA